MKIIKIDPQNPDGEFLKQLSLDLIAGKIIASPTDTVYGILGDATSPEVLIKVARIKNRSLEKPFSVFVKDINQIVQFGEVSMQQRKYLEKYLPGKVTFILEGRGVESVAVRLPNYPLINMLCKLVDRPLIATSANLAGNPETRSATQVEKEFKNQPAQPDLILDGGELPFSKPSTLLDLRTDPPKVLRQGDLKIEQL